MIKKIELIKGEELQTYKLTFDQNTLQAIKTRLEKINQEFPNNFTLYNMLFKHQPLDSKNILQKLQVYLSDKETPPYDPDIPEIEKQKLIQELLNSINYEMLSSESLKEINDHLNTLIKINLPAQGTNIKILQARIKKAQDNTTALSSINEILNKKTDSNDYIGDKIILNSVNVEPVLSKGDIGTRLNLNPPLSTEPVLIGEISYPPLVDGGYLIGGDRKTRIKRNSIEQS